MKLADLAALDLLSLLWSFGTLRPDLIPNLVPNLLPHLERQVIPFALLSGLALLIATARGATWPRGRQLWPPILVGLGLFVVPFALLEAAGERIPNLARPAIFALVPVFTVVLETHLGGSQQSRARGALFAALAAVTGAFCVFPFGIPGSIDSGLALLLTILATTSVAAGSCLGTKALGGPHAPGVAPKKPVATTAAIAGATAALAFAIASLCREQPVKAWHTLAPQLIWSITVELPALLLLFWLMKRTSATRLATRYLISPLLAIGIGTVLLRGTLELHTWLGLILMGLGAGWLLFASDEEASSSGLSLH